MDPQIKLVFLLFFHLYAPFFTVSAITTGDWKSLEKIFIAFSQFLCVIIDEPSQRVLSRPTRLLLYLVGFCKALQNYREKFDNIMFIYLYLQLTIFVLVDSKVNMVTKVFKLKTMWMLESVLDTVSLVTIVGPLLLGSFSLMTPVMYCFSKIAINTATKVIKKQ